MITVEEALERILSRVGTLGDERVALLDALDRVLAEPVVADREIPPWPNSSMDGYAVSSADTSGASAESPAALRMAGHVAAGHLAERPLARGEAFRILTGAPLPEGADAVIPQEDVQADGATVRIPRPVSAGDYVRPRGEDLRPGDRLFAPGRVLTPGDIGVLATLGRSRVRVIRRPVVGVLSTGDEIVDLGGTLRPGQIPNSNTYSLMAQVRATGAEPLSLGVARDRQDEIEARLAWGLGCDVLISSAGVSVGDHDFVKAALTALGAEQHLWLVNMRPGKPITFATVESPLKGTLPVFGLPGNPVSAMVTFELFVRPAIRRLGGHMRLTRPIRSARALMPIPNPGRRRGYLRVVLGERGGALTARLTGEQGSGILRSMSEADGLAIVPGDTTIAAGETVPVMLLREG
ncbi:MAG TPA: gephyrin-like molybdotransferase Glp [Verrucomicrobiae bacterium]|nr:gephyrin-like molybdotransferase Glp [Verrucomicrobiae bacterium]